MIMHRWPKLCAYLCAYLKKIFASNSVFSYQNYFMSLISVPYPNVSNLCGIPLCIKPQRTSVQYKYNRCSKLFYEYSLQV